MAGTVEGGRAHRADLEMGAELSPRLFLRRGTDPMLQQRQHGFLGQSYPTS